MSIDITVDTSWTGPLSDPGVFSTEMRKLADDAVWEVGQQALAEVHRLLDLSIKHPTPYYETQIRMERVQSDVSVNDRGVVYGPWLEGQSSRNKTTRFKGYSSFRRAAQRVEGQVKILTDHVVELHVRRMGG